MHPGGKRVIFSFFSSDGREKNTGASCSVPRQTMVSFLERYVATPLRKPVILTFLNRGTAVSSALDRHYSFKVDHWSIFKWEVKRNREKSREIARNREKSRKIAKNREKIKIRERRRIFWVFLKKCDFFFGFGFFRDFLAFSKAPVRRKS